MADVLAKIIKAGKVSKTVYWVGFEAEA
jgi:hypothetical protein